MNVVKRRPALSELFSPRSVAVVGVSPRNQWSFARQFLQALIEAEFPAIYPVNPHYLEVMGLSCYPTLTAIPAVVDHVMVSIPATDILALLDDCAAKQVKSVHFFTAGFSECGNEEQSALEKAILDKALNSGFRIIGPNAAGLFCSKSRLVNALGLPLEPGSVGFLSQSGGHAAALPYDMAPRGLRFSKIISYGNGLDIDESEILEYFAEDPDTGIIAAYIEGVKDGRRFAESLGKASSRKPVVICKGGRTESGKRAAFGHTASLTSSITAFTALCHQQNVILVDNIEELGEVLVALHFMQLPPEGPNMAVLGMGGGPSVSAGDEIETTGLCLPPFSGNLQAELKQLLPIAGSIFCNPLDSAVLVTPEIISATMKLLGRADGTDMFLYHLGFHPATNWNDVRWSWPGYLEAMVDALVEAKKETGKPVILALHRPSDEGRMKNFFAVQEALVKSGFPVFYSLGQAARSVSRIITWYQRRTTTNSYDK